MALAPAAADLCTSLYYLNNTYRIINVRPSNITWYSHTANVTAVSPGSVDIWTNSWTRVPAGGLNASSSGDAVADADAQQEQQQLKPLLVDCPIQACGFAVSGPYGDLQRYFVYSMLVASIAAARIEVLRGIAQLWLLSTGLASFLHIIAMLSSQEADANKFVDRDFVPATMYTATVVVAVALWTALRHVAYFRAPYRHLAVFGVWGHVLGWLVLTVLTIFVYLYYEYSGQVASAVLLQSESAFWLTGVCYRDGNGAMKPWSGVFNYGIRKASELALVELPPPPSTKPSAFIVASGRAIHPVWLETVAAGLLGLVILTGILWTALYCYGRLRWGRWWKRRSSPKSGFEKPPTFWQKLLPQVSSAAGNSLAVADQLLDICQAIPLAAAWGIFIVLVEAGIYEHGIARSEPAAQYSQWKTWVAAAVAVLVVLFARYAEARQAQEEQELRRCRLTRIPLRAGHWGSVNGGADSATGGGGEGDGGGLNGATTSPVAGPAGPAPHLARPRPVFGELNLMPNWQFRGASWRY